MEEYPSNNTNYHNPAPKPEPNRKKMDPVVTGGVVRRKKSWAKRFSEGLVTKLQVAGESVVKGVLLPAARDMAFDAGREYMTKMVYGETSRAGRSDYYRPGRESHVSYNRMYSGGSSDRYDAKPDPRTRRDRALHNFDDIILHSRVEADEVLGKLIHQVRSEYGIATVSDLYDLLGESADFTDEQWGWRDLRGASVRRVGTDAYLLDLPAPVSLTD